ncbi:MAG: cysteine--tRNA ligase [Planctomycetota bacterium]|jgi:cysteinyl-tRNA synthetase
MGLKLYNSLTRQKEEFKPAKKGKVGVYVCGPTVYGHAHLGHAKSYVSFDVLIRYLRYLGYTVTYVQNITDVGHLTDDADEGEDKIVVEARKEKKHPMAVAEFYTNSYFEDMDKLNCVRPDISPRASGHIVEQIELVKTLLDKGYAYEVNGSVYFDVSKFKDYGKLSGRNVEDMLAGARVEVSQDKKKPVDFALWKKAEPNHIMQWPSPWGPGYPGWHLECSVMSMKYLGKTIDIHGGGLENQFPHHECEIAQSEAANGVQFVRYWVHHNMVTVDGQKMGKSLNNFITLKQAFSGAHERLTRSYDPLAVRQLILNSHYRSPLDFSDAALFAAQSGCEKITETVKAVRKGLSQAPEGEIDKQAAEELKQLREKFEAAMNDDLNTSIALSVMFELVRLANKLLEEKTATMGTLNAVAVLFDRLGGEVLGIVKDIYDDITLAEFINNFIERRDEARNKKDFAAADSIRNRLDEIGIVLEDKPDGTTWRPK